MAPFVLLYIPLHRRLSSPRLNVEGNRLVGWKEAQVHHEGREENKREKERITQRQLRNSVGCVN